MHTVNVADAAHDEGVIRAVGFGWTGAWRSLDAVVAASAMVLPIGTRSMRAGLASALVVGVAGIVVYELARRLLAACSAGATSPRLGALVAWLASLTTAVGATWQLEAASPGGAVLGALLALAPILVLMENGRASIARAPLAAGAVGLAVGYEPLVGLAALASTAALALVEWTTDRPRVTPAVRRRLVWTSVLLFCAGLLPLALGALRSRTARELSLGAPAMVSWAGERGASVRATPLAFAESELGWVVIALAMGGATLAMFAPRARAIAAALIVLTGVGLASIALGVPAGPTRFGGPVLAAVAGALALSAIAMQAIVRGVATAKIPFARASAAMIVVLELTLPVHMADDALARSFDRARGTAATWESVAWGPVPAGAVMMVSDPRVMTRIVAERAAGTMRGDLAVVPTYDLGGFIARASLTHEPRLAPFWRDMALLNVPDEFSLSTLASTRPLVMAFDPRWDKALARHLVPVGLVARFETEPRGASDRRRALDGFAVKRDRLMKETVIQRDPELLELTAQLLRARAIALAASGDRDMVIRGIDDLHVFSPYDAVADTLAHRAAITKGPVDVKDLRP
jgi:hypothetical protein